MKRKLVALGILIAVLLLVFGGCEAVSGWFAAAVEDYFPFEEGAEWSYTARLEFYEDTKDPDFDTVAEFGITLYVAGTREIGGVETYEMKVKDFTTDDLEVTADDLAEINEMIGSGSIFVGATAEGLEIFAVEVDQSDASETLPNGYASSFSLVGTFSQGLPILPPFIFQGATSEFDLATESTYTDYDGVGDVYYTRVSTMDVDAEFVVTTDGDKIEVLGKDYKGAHVVTNVVAEDSYTRTYPDFPEDNESDESTVTNDGEVFIAEKLGLAFISMEWDWGSATENEGMPHTISLDLTDTNVDD
jgi:hypothetical protein